MELNTITLGDTLSVLRTLPSDYFDVGVTSPPYNKGEKNKGWLVDSVQYDGIRDTIDEEDYQHNQKKVLNQLCRVTKTGGSFFYNHKLRWNRGVLIHPFQWVSQTDWAIRQEIIWNRRIAAQIRGWRFWQLEERIYWLYKPRPEEIDAPIGTELESRHAKMGSVWEIRPESKLDWAPDPFPLELPTRCLYSILGEGKGRVIDPYSGSGTTLVAAKLLDYEYFGIEISECYRTKAQDRINSALSELEKFQKEIDKHQVELTFKQRKARGMIVSPLASGKRDTPITV